jgi:Rab GDP dissociation inhibitor
LDLYEPSEDGKSDNIFVTRSYDATSHFETVVQDLKDVYQRYSGNPLSVDKKVRGTVEEEQQALSGQ